MWGYDQSAIFHGNCENRWSRDGLFAGSNFETLRNINDENVRFSIYRRLRIVKQ